MGPDIILHVLSSSLNFGELTTLEGFRNPHSIGQGAD